MEKVVIVAILGLTALAMAVPYDEKDITAYHFHTYFFEENPRHLEEALSFRRATRALIKSGFLADCSLNEITPGVDGPHPFGQYELCCNKTSFPEATAWHMQNHGNLSILVHPLTVEDQADHMERITWIGQAVPLDAECPCLYPLLPKPRPCPVYPEYPDFIPDGARSRSFPPLPGTEDYRNISRINLLATDY